MTRFNPDNKAHFNDNGCVLFKEKINVKNYKSLKYMVWQSEKKHLYPVNLNLPHIFVCVKKNKAQNVN